MPGIVLSGGGARGAYEVGVLKYICEELCETGQAPFPVLSGSSVGAVHAAYMAAMAYPSPHTRDISYLAGRWTSMDLGEMVRFDFSRVFNMFRPSFLGRPNYKEVGARGPAGLMRTESLERLIVDAIRWQDLRQAVRHGHIRGLAVPATQIYTGNAIVFYDRAPGVPDIDWKNDPGIIARRTGVGPLQVLASAAIPMLFPPVRIGDRYYGDGSLRVNTPLSPALRLGATHLCVVRLRQADASANVKFMRESEYNNPFFLAGKALDALLLDPIDRDLNNLEMINSLLTEIAEANPDNGQEFLSRWSQHHRGAPYQHVTTVVVSPSVDFSVIVENAVRQMSHMPPIWRRLQKATNQDNEGTLDLASYAFFDRRYTGPLIETGYSDAKAMKDQLLTVINP